MHRKNTDISRRLPRAIHLPGSEAARSKYSNYAKNLRELNRLQTDFCTKRIKCLRQNIGCICLLSIHAHICSKIPSLDAKRATKLTGFQGNSSPCLVCLLLNQPGMEFPQYAILNCFASTIADKTQGALSYFRIIFDYWAPQPPFSMLIGK